MVRFEKLDSFAQKAPNNPNPYISIRCEVNLLSINQCTTEIKGPIELVVGTVKLNCECLILCRL